MQPAAGCPTLRRRASTRFRFNGFRGQLSNAAQMDGWYARCINSSENWEECEDIV